MTYCSTKNPINKLGMNNRRLLIATEFHFVHPVEKTFKNKTSWHETLSSSAVKLIVWEQVYSRGKLVLKASHWSWNVRWDIIVMKSFGGKFATCSNRNYRGLKFSPMEANMKTRLESKILCNSRKQAVLLTKFACNIQLAALSKFLTYFCSIRGHVTF